MSTLCALSSVAQAQSSTPNIILGHWFPSYEWASGQGSGVYTNDDPLVRHYPDPDNHDYTFDIVSGTYTKNPHDPLYGSSLAYSSQYSHGLSAYLSAPSWKSTASVQVQASGKVTYRWKPANGQPLPTGAQLAKMPDTLNILVTGDVSKGNGDDVHRKQLYKFDTKGSTEFSMTMDVNGKDSIVGDPQGNPGEASVGLNVSSKEDERSVRLTRNGKDIFKTEDGMWVTYGDSRYSYFLRTIKAGTDIQEDLPQIVTQTINAAPVGKWSALDPTYQWGNPSSTDTRTQHTERMPQGGSIWNPDGINFSTSLDPSKLWNQNSYPVARGVMPGGWNDNSPSGSGPIVVSYTLTDTDGATANAKYVLTLHDEWEHAEPDNSFSWTEAGTNDEHHAESLEGYFMKDFGGATAPESNAKWTISSTADLSVELKAETSANFGVADWLKFSGSATASTKLDFNTSIEYTVTPQTCGIAKKNADETDDTSVSYQPVIRYYIKSKRILLDHYTDEGRDINPARDPHFALGPGAPSDGKWPKKGEVGTTRAEAWWILVDQGQGPYQGGGEPLPTPTPPPSPSPTPAPLRSGNSEQQTLIQPSGNSS